MRHCLLVACVLGACGGGDGGEPIGGTIAIDVGDDTVTPTVGAALPDENAPGKLAILIGTRDVSCETTNDSPIKPGTYLSISGIDPVVGEQMPFVAVIRVEAGGAHLNGTSGDVTIDSFDGGRVTGSITFMTDDEDDAGNVIPITADGTFDVIDCTQ
jgi:hypothetical protein